jgi:hypothetical protein
MNPSDQHDKPQTFTASLPPGLSINPSRGVVCRQIAFAPNTAITEADADVPFIRPSGPTKGTDPNNADGPRKAAPDAPEQSEESGPTKP